MNRRKFITTLMKEKNDFIMSECGISIYDNEDYQFFDDENETFTFEIFKVYKKMYSLMKHDSFIPDTDTDPFCVYQDVWCCRDCSECFYGEHHGICDVDQDNKYEKVLNIIHKRINLAIGYDVIRLFFKWNSRLV